MVYTRSMGRSSAKKITKRRNYKRKMVGSVPSSIKKYVNTVINRKAENKVSPYSTNTSNADVVLIPMSTVLTSTATILSLHNVWTLAQGTGEAQRIGNSINPKKWKLSIYIHNNGSANIPCLVRMIVFKSKTGYGTPFGVLTQPTDILQIGNSSSGGVGNYLDLNRPINTDRYTLYYNKVFKIGGAVSGTTLGNANNDFSCVRHFNINLMKYQGHTMKYSDGTSTAPSNAGLYCAFFIAPYGGNSLTQAEITAGNYPQISYDMMAEFEDA